MAAKQMAEIHFLDRAGNRLLLLTIDPAAPAADYISELTLLAGQLYQLGRLHERQAFHTVLHQVLDRAAADQLADCTVQRDPELATQAEA